MDRIERGLAIALLAAMAFFIAAAPAPYFHDFGEWLYQARILALKITDPAAVTGFVVAPYPVPNSLAPVLLALLCLVFEPLAAGKVFLLLLLGGWLWSLWRFARRFVSEDNRGATLLLLVAVVALASYFWYGFVSYQLGLLLFFTFLTSFDGRRSPLWIASFGAALFFAHAMVFLAWGLLVSLLALAGPVRSRRHILLALAPIGLLAVWFVLGRRLTGFEAPVADAGMEGVAELILYKFGSPLLLGGFRNLLRPDGVSLLEPYPWVYWLGAASNALVVLALGIFVLLAFLKPDLRAVSESVGEPSSPALPVQALRGFGLVTISFYLIAPYNFFGLIHPGGRLLLPLLAVAMALADRRAFRWVRQAAPLAALGATISVGSYGVLMDQTAGGDGFAHGAESLTEGPPRHSVFAFNHWLYRNTRYKYFNYRIFAYGGRFEQIRIGHYRDLGARTGLLTGYQPRP